jgi:thiamine kinase-like enzyme
MEVWPILSQEEKASYSRQLADAIRQLRQFTAPRPQKVDGSQLDDVVIGRCAFSRPGNCFKIGYTVNEWLDSLGVDLRMGLSTIHKTVDPIVIEEKFQELKASFPNCEPYVLTHADLNLSNIIVKDGKIQGIVDWEMAGYYPWWMERRATYRNSNDASDELFEPVWKELMPEIDFEKWLELIDEKTFPAQKAWGHCMHAHPGIYDVWQKAPFCECRPIQGVFKACDWGMPFSCKIYQLTAEQEALLEGYKRKDPWALKHEEDSDASPSGGDESK